MGSPQFQTKKRRIEGAEGLGDDSGVPSDPGTNQPPDTSDDCEIELVVVKDAKDSKTTPKQTPKSVGRKTPNRMNSKKRPSGSIVSTKNTGAMNSKNSAGIWLFFSFFRVGGKTKSRGGRNFLKFCHFFAKKLKNAFFDTFRH